MFIMCFVPFCLQDWVCRRENADQLVYVPPLQVSEGNNFTEHVELLGKELAHIVNSSPSQVDEITVTSLLPSLVVIVIDMFSVYNHIYIWRCLLLDGSNVNFFGCN